MFDNYLTLEETKVLYRTYRLMDFKRFHYSNAATYVDDRFTDFYSYKTLICSIYKPIHEINSTSLCVYPFIYDTDNYLNSPTTNKQLNRFIKEFMNADFTVHDIRYIYKQLINDYSVPALKTYNGKDVSLLFSDTNYYISDNHIRQCLSKSTTHADFILNEYGYYAPRYWEVRD